MSDDDLKRRARKILGGRCVSPECRWLNEDGTMGCTDERVLVFDHKWGGGSQERREGKGVRSICYEILNAIERLGIDPSECHYQLLCANCHEIKTKPEKQGARQHKKPARVRRSLQKPGEEPRRVKTP